MNAGPPKPAAATEAIVVDRLEVPVLVVDVGAKRVVGVVPVVGREVEPEVSGEGRIEVPHDARDRGRGGQASTHRTVHGRLLGQKREGRVHVETNQVELRVPEVKLDTDRAAHVQDLGKNAGRVNGQRLGQAQHAATHAGVLAEGAVEDEARVQLGELAKVVLRAVGFLQGEHVAFGQQASDPAELGRPFAGVVGFMHEQPRDVPRDKP